MNTFFLTTNKLKCYLTSVTLHFFFSLVVFKRVSNGQISMCHSRYGLPVNFQAMLLQPNKKTMKRLREVLNELYKHLDSSAAAIIDVSSVISLFKGSYYCSNDQARASKTQLGLK